MEIKSCFSGRNNVIRRKHICFKHKFTLTRKKNTWAKEMLTNGKQLHNVTLLTNIVADFIIDRSGWLLMNEYVVNTGEVTYKRLEPFGIYARITEGGRFYL